jgi:hypothetical protein
MSEPDEVACAVQPSLEDLDDEAVAKILQLADGRIHGVASSCTRLLHMVRAAVSMLMCAAGQTTAQHTPTDCVAT